MGLKEEIIDMKKEVQEVQSQSFAMEIVKTLKLQNKRLFIIWIITFIALVSLSFYTIYLINDVSNIDATEIRAESGSGDAINNYGDYNNVK